MSDNSLPTDDELFIAIKNDDMVQFLIKYNSAFVYQLRFTDSLYNILHLCCYYQRKEMIANLLDSQNAIQLINGRDRNGETPLHLICFYTNSEIALILMNKGASLMTKNIYGKDPIDIISNYSRRKNFVLDLISKKPKVHVKEIELLKLHRKQCEYIESLSELIFAQDNRHQFKIDRGLIEANDFDMPSDKIFTRNKTDHMSALKEFKIGLRPHEEFYFPQTSNGGQYLQPELDFNKENSQISPNFGANSENQSMKNSLKPSIKQSGRESTVNLNNYVSQKNFDFNDLPKGAQDDQRDMEEQFRSIQQSFIDPSLLPNKTIQNNLSQFPTNKKFYNNYQSRILTPQKYETLNQFADDEDQPEQPNFNPVDPSSPHRSQNLLPQFNYHENSAKNQIKQAPDEDEAYMFDYRTVKESNIDTYNDQDNTQHHNSRFTQNSHLQSVNSYRGIKQQRDEAEEFPPHSSTKKYPSRMAEDSNLKNQQTAYRNDFVIKESAEFDSNTVDEEQGQNDDPYRTVGVSQINYRPQPAPAYSTIKQTMIMNDNPYQTYKVDNQSGLTSQYMTMNLDDVQNGGQNIANNRLFDKLNRFDRSERNQQYDLDGMKKIKFEDKSGQNKQTGNSRFL